MSYAEKRTGIGALAVVARKQVPRLNKAAGTAITAVRIPERVTNYPRLFLFSIPIAQPILRDRSQNLRALLRFLSLKVSARTATPRPLRVGKAVVGVLLSVLFDHVP